MTGGSLGLRTGSYGSLQQQLQNTVLLPIQTSPVIPRKPSKMLLSGPRERERFRSCFCRIVGRRKIGMLLLVLISVAAVISILWTFSKDEDSPEAMDTQPGSTQHVHTVGPNGRVVSSHYESPLISGEQDSNKNNKSIPEILSPSGENTTLQPVVFMDTLPPVHPCENFAFPPPPADKKRIGPRPCPVCYVPVEQAIGHMPRVPSVSPVLKNLTYFFEENPISNQPFGGSVFGGYPSLEQRNESFTIKESMSVYCGFVRGNKPGHQTGFDMDDADLLEMEQCRGVVVASAIFGNYDIIQQPKNISDSAKRNACFYMFVDEETEAYIKNSSTLDSTKRLGLWRIVVVRNLPYVDARRNGKVPKLLLHRIFPNARFSIWIDGKLELNVDPYQILERFLWRENVTFAISKHYRRFDVFEEAAANKAAGKYDNASIDYQVEFYRREGLTPYTERKIPITSDVPEGCVIIREHIPITNLFTCLWFNEVDRFTSRDQLSFSTVRDKIRSKVDWNLHMFLDCERRNFVVQAYHKEIMEQKNTFAATVHPPPRALTNQTPRKALPDIAVETVKTPVKKMPLRRGREKRLGSRRHRSRAANGRDNNSF